MRISRGGTNRHQASSAAVTLLVAVGLLGGCSGPQEPKVSPERTLATAKRNLDATSGVRIGLSTDTLPAGVDGLLSADGIGTHDPAFTGDLKVSAQGLVVDAAVVAVDNVVHAKLPFTTRYAPIDPETYGAPDPADLMESDGGLSSLLTAATDVDEGEQVREGEEVLTRYAATVPGSAVADVIPSASSSADFAGTFTVTAEGTLSTAVLTGPFYPDAEDVTYTITFADYGTEREITAP